MLKPAAFVLGLLLVGCSPQAPQISARDAWARETGSADTAAAYLTIDNKGSADRLTGVRSGIGQASLHETSMEGGIMRMRPIAAGDGLVVPSNGKLVLSPGGAHVMLMGLKRPLKPGDRFPLTLLFAKSRPERVAVTVRPAAARPM